MFNCHIWLPEAKCLSQHHPAEIPCWWPCSGEIRPQRSIASLKKWKSKFLQNIGKLYQGWCVTVLTVPSILANSNSYSAIIGKLMLHINQCFRTSIGLVRKWLKILLTLKELSTSLKTRKLHHISWLYPHLTPMSAMCDGWIPIFMWGFIASYCTPHVCMFVEWFMVKPPNFDVYIRCFMATPW